MSEQSAGTGVEFEPPRIFLDIGSGILPYGVHGDRTFADHDSYIAIELPSSAAYTRVRDDDKHLWFLYADGRQLPLPDESVHEIYYGNVFGSSKMAVLAIAGFLQEARRVLQPQGRLVVHESLTPNVSPRRRMARHLRRAGWTVEAQVAQYRVAYDELNDTYDASPSIGAKRGKYYVIATKGVEP